MSPALRVLCLAGPTGSGKSAAALELATTLNGEIINADSRQVYTAFPLITAQPSPEEQARCPHHLYGFMDTEQKLSAGRWADNALTVAHEVASRGKTPILVGGTGLYFRALLEGIADIPPVSADIARRWAERCRDEGPEALHQLLREKDPDYAARIHPRDRQRVERALAVQESTGKSFSWWHSHAMPAPRCQGLYFGLDVSLDELTPRLAARIDAMLATGAVEEARLARESPPPGQPGGRNADATSPGWSGIGCAELWRYLEGELSLEQTVALWLHNTRAYAKRQLTWFRAEKNLIPFAPHNIKGLYAAARNFL